MTRRCADCGSAFDAAGTWQRCCRRCWRHRKDRDAARRVTDAYRRGYDAGRADAQPATPMLEPDLLRAALVLCHPDRHPAERADQAHRATIALLDLRSRARETTTA